MTNHRKNSAARLAAFTLIELLVVIAIIAILAALIFPAAGVIKKRSIVNTSQTALQQVATAVELYKEKLGFYPPDNPGQPHLNALFYELSGTELRGNPPAFETLDGTERLTAAEVTAGFGANIAGFVNCNKGGGDDAGARNFLKTGLKPGQYGFATTNGVRLRLLTCPVEWPANHAYQPLPSNPGLNPWRYVSTNPTNNPGSYDLWVDVLIANKTYRISNWSKQPQVVPTP